MHILDQDIILVKTTKNYFFESLIILYCGYILRKRDFHGSPFSMALQGVVVRKLCYCTWYIHTIIKLALPYEGNNMHIHLLWIHRYRWSLTV